MIKMKKHLSVFMLMARSTIYRLLILLLAMAAAQALLFHFTLNAATAAADAGLGPDTLETVISRSHIAWVFAICFVLMAVLLCLTGCNYGSRQENTLRRLSVSERSVFVWQMLYNIACFFLLWVAQALIALALCRWYTTVTDPSFVSGQTIFLAFYRNSFLHSLLPLEEGSRWVRNIMLVIGLGAACAQVPIYQRRGKISITIIAMTSLTLVFFSRSIGCFGNDMLIILLSAINIGAVLKNVMGRCADEET